MSWIVTRSGRKFDLANPTADMVDTADLAAAPAQDVTGLVEAISPALHWAGSFRDAWPEDSEYPDGAWVVGAVLDGEQYPIITVNADQYDAPGDSEKIARAIIALWAAALDAHDKQSGGAA